MPESSHAAVAAIAALSDAEATQVLYRITLWLIGAAAHELTTTPQQTLDQIIRLAGQYPGGRWVTP